MHDDQVPERMRLLLSHNLPTVDHVTVLVALHDASAMAHTAESMARTARLSKLQAAVVLDQLKEAGFASQSASGYTYSLERHDPLAVDELAQMYNTRPVTLIRAIYARPTSPVRSFADAFRIRKGNE